MEFRAVLIIKIKRTVMLYYASLKANIIHLIIVAIINLIIFRHTSGELNNSQKAHSLYQNNAIKISKSRASSCEGNTNYIINVMTRDQ